MPEPVGRERVRELVAAGAQLVEVLPAEEYGWAHLPAARSLPLKQFEDRLAELDRARAVVVYCHDTL